MSQSQNLFACLTQSALSSRLPYTLLPSSFLLLTFLVVGCRTNKDILNDYEKALLAGDYSGPVAEIEERAEDGGVDELLWWLHAGGSRYRMND